MVSASTESINSLGARKKSGRRKLCTITWRIGIQSMYPIEEGNRRGCLGEDLLHKGVSPARASPIISALC